MKRYLGYRYILGCMGMLMILILAACGGEMNHSTNTAPFDAQFIDGMKAHHQGAIDMANEAKTKAEHAEIKTMADTIITTQQNELTNMQKWRDQWYPGLAPTHGMDMDMGDMNVSTDTSKPYDQRFLEAMISHHQGAIDMANEAKTKAEHAEIKTLADDIITAQTTEIKQMQTWLSQWYNVNSTPTSMPGHH